MCLKAVFWVNLPLDQHDMPTYQFMKSSAALKLSVPRLLLEGRSPIGWRSSDIAFFAGGRRNATIRRRHLVLVRLDFSVFRRRSLAHVSSFWNLHVSHVERRGGTNCDDELSTQPSSSAFGGVVKFRRTIAAAMETVTSSWLWLPRNFDAFIVLRIDIYKYKKALISDLADVDREFWRKQIILIKIWSNFVHCKIWHSALQCFIYLFIYYYKTLYRIQ